MKEPTQQYSDTIKSLQSRIQALEDENRLLKERLEEAGVSYADIVSGDAEGVVELYILIRVLVLRNLMLRIRLQVISL